MVNSFSLAHERTYHTQRKRELDNYSLLHEHTYHSEFLFYFSVVHCFYLTDIITSNSYDLKSSKEERDIIKTQKRYLRYLLKFFVLYYAGLFMNYLRLLQDASLSIHRHPFMRDFILQF